MFSNFIEKDNRIVNNGWAKWIHYGVPDNEGTIREIIRTKLFIMGHCLECSVLSGCYFVKYKLPKKKVDGNGLLHPNCDCNLIDIKTPINQVVADCDLNKFTNYIFSEKYQHNGKIELFKSLGFKKEDSFYLKSEFDKQAKTNYLNGNY